LDITVETIKLSSKGQLVIPKKFRDALNLEGGEYLTVELKGNQLVLRKLSLNEIIHEAEEDSEKGKTTLLWPEKE